MNGFTPNLPGKQPAAQPTAAAASATTAATDPTKQSSHKTIVNAPFQIMPLQQRETWLKLLVYGAHGTGKTTLVGSAADVSQMGDILMIDAESGDMTLQDNPRIKNKDAISHIRATSFKQVAFVHDFLKAHCAARDANNVEALKNLESKVTGVPASEIQEPKRFKTVIIDSLTEVETYCLYALLGMDQNKIVTDPSEMEVAQFAEFRKNNEMTKMLVRAFRDLPMHVLFVCAVQYTQDEQKKFHYTPSLTGKLSAQVQGFMDIVGFIIAGQAPEGQEAPRRMYVQPTGTGGARFDAKNRRSSFRESYLDNPTMSSLMKAVGLLK